MSFHAQEVPATEEDIDENQRLSFSSERAERLWKELFGDTLSPDEVGEVLGVDRTTVMRWLRDKTLVGFQTGRTWRIRESDLREYVQRVETQERCKGTGIVHKD